MREHEQVKTFVQESTFDQNSTAVWKLWRLSSFERIQFKHPTVGSLRSSLLHISGIPDGCGNDTLMRVESYK